MGLPKPSQSQKVLPKVSHRLPWQKVTPNPTIRDVYPATFHPPRLPQQSPGRSQHTHAHPYKHSPCRRTPPHDQPAAQLLPQSPDLRPCLRPSYFTLPRAATTPVPTDAPLCPFHQLRIFTGSLESTQTLKLGVRDLLLCLVGLISHSPWPVPCAPSSWSASLLLGHIPTSLPPCSAHALPSAHKGSTTRLCL